MREVPDMMKMIVRENLLKENGIDEGVLPSLNNCTNGDCEVSEKD